MVQRTNQDNYNVAVALLQFKAAWMNLAKTTKELDDLDLGEAYPFYLLDFEEIAPAVSQWCSIHAGKLMRELPILVDNPACLKCEYLRVGTDNEGMCKGLKETMCGIYPSIPYSRKQVVPYLSSIDIKTDDLNDDMVHLLYLRKVDEIYEERDERKTESCRTSDSTLHTDNSTTDVPSNETDNRYCCC